MLREGTAGVGGVSVMVVLLGGSVDAAEASPIVGTDSAGVGRVVLARPIDLDTAGDPAWDEMKEEAADVLAGAALFLGGPEPTQVLLPGRGSGPIADYAVAHGIDHVVVLGNRAVQRSVCRHPDLRERVMVVVTRHHDASGVFGRR